MSSPVPERGQKPPVFSKKTILPVELYSDDPNEIFYYFSIPEFFRNHVREWNKEFRIPWQYVYRTGQRESNWSKYPKDNINYDPVTKEIKSRDVGTWQLNSKNFPIYYRLDPKFDPRDPLSNTHMGMRQLYGGFLYFNHWPKAIMSYNWGYPRILKKKTPPHEVKEYVNYVLGVDYYSLN